MQARSDILFIIGDLRPSKWLKSSEAQLCADARFSPSVSPSQTDGGLHEHVPVSVTADRCSRIVPLFWLKLNTI